MRPRAVLVLLVMLCCANAWADSRPVIQGGKGVGMFLLGKKFSSYQKQLGEPTKVMTSEQSDTTKLVYFKKYGMYFYVAKDTINGINIESPLFFTPEGIRVGAQRDEVLRTYGEPQNLQGNVIVYPERGLSFSFKNGRVALIAVEDKQNRDLAMGDLNIVPGLRVGGIRLGQSTDFLVQQWKAPSKKEAFKPKKGAEMWTYPKKGILVLNYQGRIDMIMVINPAYHTNRNIHIGSSRDEVSRAYGRPSKHEDKADEYADKGITFRYSGGAVQEIWVNEIK